MTTRATIHFLKTEAGAGLLLGLAAAVALVWANSPWSAAYFDLLHFKITLGAGTLAETHDVADWIKEGLMAVFFFVVGLEIKQEVLRGELSDQKKLALPVLGAIGGMVIPAAIYLAVNLAPGGDLRGWSAPVATDIAFALAALAAVGRNLPPSLRLFLLTLAIVDDLGAVLIIAFAYSGAPQWGPLIGAGAALAVMAGLSLWKRTPLVVWFLGFLVVGAFVLRSGVSTSLAGILAAMVVPLGDPDNEDDSPLKHLMEALHPWTAYLILPAFAFSAAGLNLAEMGSAALGPPTVGVILGLVVGKALGVGGAAVAAVASGLARRPDGATWTEVFGVALLCGVGFTMSLFITTLAFEGQDSGQAAVKLGVMAGSLIAALLGMAVLGYASRRRAAAGLDQAS